MQSFASTTLFGRVGGLPTMETVGETNVAKFSIATNHYRKSASGEMVEETTWFNCVAWGKPAEQILKHVNKGDRLYVQGRPRHRDYTAKDGSKRVWSDTLVEKVILIDKKPTPRADKPLATLDVDRGQLAAAQSYEDSDVPF